jgi:hypothetical protein
MKRIFIFLGIVILAYYTTGFTLLSIGYIDKLPVFVNKIIKNKSDNDTSVAAADGPLVFHSGNKILVYGIKSVGRELKTECDTFLNENKLLLQSGSDAGRSFTFYLKDSLEVEHTDYELPEKMLILSDIEGNLDAFSSILISAKVVDSAFNWTFDKGHLVLVGDFVDRGLNVTETLWLIYKLEEEAKRSGGKVHFILGNHEVMNLQGKIKYVRKKYVENADRIKVSYKDWFSSQSEIGRWLRTKNIVERIGPFVFVHGGISPELASTGMSLKQINFTFREYLDRPSSIGNDEDPKLIFDSRLGPYWYRGLINEEASKEDVNKIMNYLGAKQIIVGHTLVDSISTFYEGRVIGIDLPHEESIKRNKVEALRYEKGRFYVIDNNEEQKELREKSNRSL